jgi:hypothetical protein
MAQGLAKLFFLGTGFHAYTLRWLVASQCGGQSVAVHPLTYDAAFAAERLAPGCYIFTDIERLSAYERRLAAGLYRAMAARRDRFTPLNDPARARFRYALLRALHEDGVNGFDAYRADGWPRPRRFPVFLKAEADHGPALSDLLPDQAALDAALVRLPAEGRPLDGIVVIEFAGEPIAPGVWTRFTAFNVAGAILPDLPVTEGHWMVKTGAAGLVDDAGYARHDRMIREGHHAAVLARAFQLAGIDFGRADFGLLGGRAQIFEINTNPNMPGLDPPHPSARRQATHAFTWGRLTQALARLARLAPSGADEPLDQPLVADHRARGGEIKLTWRP